MFGLVLFMGTWLPIKRRNREGEPLLVWIKNHADAMQYNVTVAEQSDAASKLFKQVQALIGVPLFPENCFGRVRSLYALLESYMANGIQCRPAFDNQDQVVDMVTGYIANSRQLPILNGTLTQWEEDRPLSCVSFLKLTARVVGIVKTVKQSKATGSAEAHAL